MNIARVFETGEVVRADEISKLFPNFNEIVFLCVDEKCSVRMAPSSIIKSDLIKPHFKKYKGRDHDALCEYATVSVLLQEGKKRRLSDTEIKKIGYPSVFKINLGDTENLTLDNVDNNNLGVTTSSSTKPKGYQFDEMNLVFDKRNKVESIDKIVNWYIGFPDNRHVKIEINGSKIEYRYFFKKIENYSIPKQYPYERIFYGRVKLSRENEELFKSDKNLTEIVLLDDAKKAERKYKVKLDRNKISTYSYSRIKNKFEYLFNKAFQDLKNNQKQKDYYLYVFIHGVINEEAGIVEPLKNYITFRYTNIEPTPIE